MADIKQITVGSTTYDIKDAKANVAYGTCTTAAAIAAKVVTVANNASWSLTAGSMVTVLFSNTNTASNPTLNVNSTGAKNIYYGTAQITTSNLSYAGYASRLMTFMYDGTQYRFICWGVDNNSNTVPSVQMETAAGTAAKVGTCTNHTLLAKSYVHVNIRYTNTYAGAITLNIDSAGAKPIYLNGSATSSSNYNLAAGTYIAYYDGTNFYFRTDGKLTADITGSAGKVANALTFNNGGSGVASGTTFDGSTARTISYNTIGAAASSHNHAASNITSGTLSSDRLPTVPITKGGTGATTAAAALTNLGLTATAAELNYVDGVTSNIQTQLNGKATAPFVVTATFGDTYGDEHGVTFGYVNDMSATPQEIYTAYEAGRQVILKITSSTAVSLPTPLFLNLMRPKKSTDCTFGGIDPDFNMISINYYISGGTTYCQYRIMDVASAATATIYKNGLMSKADKTKLDGMGYTYGTEDLTAGTSELATGQLYFVYE